MSNLPIETLYGITKEQIKKLHSEGIFLVKDIHKAKFKLSKTIKESARLKEFEQRVTRDRGALEFENLTRILSGMGELILAGSYRRGISDMKDLDFMLVTDSSDMSEVLKALSKSIVPEYFPILHGHVKIMMYSLMNSIAIRIDLNIVPVLSRAVALVHFTGPAESNIRMRVNARRHGLQLNEKYIMNLETGEVFYPKTEREVFEMTGNIFKEPENR